MLLATLVIPELSNKRLLATCIIAMHNLLADLRSIIIVWDMGII